MARITISDLRPVEDSESFLHDVSDTDSIRVQGGQGYGFSEFLGFGVKVLEYALVGFAIHNIVSLVSLFLAPRNTGLSIYRPSSHPPTQTFTSTVEEPNTPNLSTLVQ